jgi:hypothetical protein
MNKITFFAFLLTSLSAFGQKGSTNAFVGLHYTGCSYHSASTGYLNGLSVRPFNSGFGATVNVHASRLVSFELAYDVAFLQETVTSVSPTDQSYKRQYNIVETVYGVRIGIGKTTESWSLQGLLGFGVRASPRGHTDRFFQDKPTQHIGGNNPGNGSGSISLGIRGTYNLSDRFLLNLTMYTNFSPLQYEPDNPHNTEPTLVPVGTRFLYFANVGIAYRFKI